MTRARPPRREKSDLRGAFGVARSDVGCFFPTSIGADLGRGADAAWLAAATYHRSGELGVHNPRSSAWIALAGVVRRSSCRFGWVLGGFGGASRSLALSRASRLPSFPPKARMALFDTDCMMLDIGLIMVLAMKAASNAWLRARPTVPLTMPAAVEGTTVVRIRRITESATRFNKRCQLSGALQTVVIILVGGTP